MSSYPNRVNIVQHFARLRTLSNSEYDVISYFARAAHALDVCVM